MYTHYNIIREKELGEQKRKVMFNYTSHDYGHMSHLEDIGGIRGTVVARWTAGRQIERCVLHQVHDL